MSTVIIAIIWLIAGVFCFRVCRADLATDSSAAADFICSLLFWWIVLPFLAAFTGRKLGRHYAERFIDWQKHRHVKPQLRAGMDNGLYD